MALCLWFSRSLLNDYSHMKPYWSTLDESTLTGIGITNEELEIMKGHYLGKP